jgi:hypothetical protein
VATANLAQYHVVISLGTNMFDWDEATVTDLQKSKWVFADREMRKVRAPADVAAAAAASAASAAAANLATPAAVNLAKRRQ